MPNDNIVAATNRQTDRHTVDIVVAKSPLPIWEVYHPDAVVYHREMWRGW